MPAHRFSPRKIGGLFLGLAIVILSVGWWLWPRTPTPSPPLPDLSEADPEVAEAVGEARQQVLRQAKDAAAWGRLGMILRAHDFGREANSCLAEAERLDPRDPRWPYLQGLTLLLSDPDAGIRCLERAVARGEDDLLAPRLRLAEALLESGRLDEAQARLDQVQQREPHHPRLQLDLGRLAVLRQQWAKAADYLQRCADDDHARKQAHILLADVWTHLNHPEKARAEQRQAGQAAEDRGWPDPIVEEVLQLRSGLGYRLERAAAWFQQGNFDESIRTLQETVTRYPESTRAYLQLGDTWRQLGRLKEAEQSFHEAARIDPNSCEAWFRLGCVQARDRPRDSADSFRRALRIKPDHTLAHFNLAHRLKELGDPAGAAREFREALRCRPDYAPAREALRQLEMGKKPIG